MNYLDLEKATKEDYFGAIHDFNLEKAIILDDNYSRKIKEKAIEWITQCAILNLQISRKEFITELKIWERNLSKRKSPLETPKEKA